MRCRLNVLFMLVWRCYFIAILSLFRVHMSCHRIRTQTYLQTIALQNDKPFHASLKQLFTDYLHERNKSQALDSSV